MRPHPEFGGLSNLARWRAEVGRREAVAAAFDALIQLHANSIQIETKAS